MREGSHVTAFGGHIISLQEREHEIRGAKGVGTFASQQRPKKKDLITGKKEKEEKI